MASEVRFSRGEKWVLGLTALLGCSSFAFLLFLPWLSRWVGWFPADDQTDTTPIQAVLSQLGTYGDLFGMLNCLFSGAAFWGVAYALILQRHELHHSQEAEASTRRSNEIQARLGLYQFLVEQHRHEKSEAGDDILLKARSNGRARAYAELIGDLLKELDFIATGGRSEKPPADFHDHPFRIAHLKRDYDDDKSDYTSLSVSFEPRVVLLLRLVEEIAGLTELIRGNDVALTALSHAGHAINAAVMPEDVLDSEERADPQFVREYQIQYAKVGFSYAFKALDALGTLEPMGIKLRIPPIG